MNDAYKRFVYKLFAEINERGLRFADVAKEMHVGQTTVYNWRNFKCMMKGADMLKAMELYMGVEI